jgi:hypothetical protein
LTKKIAILLVLLFFVLISCGQEEKPTKSDSSFLVSSLDSHCKEGVGKVNASWGNGKLILSAFNDTIRVLHSNAYYNCCSDVRMEVKKTGLGFDVYEKDYGDTCRCMCNFDLITFVYNLNAGTYLMRLFDIWGNISDQGYVVIKEKEQGGPGG